MAYARQLLFANLATIPAGTGDNQAWGTRVGVNDEVLAAWMEATSLGDAHIAAGSIDVAHEAAPWHQYELTFAGALRLRSLTDAYGDRRRRGERMIGFHRGRVPFRLDAVDVSISAYDTSATVIWPTVRIRLNAPAGPLVCRSLRLRDFFLHDSIDQDAGVAEGPETLVEEEEGAAPTSRRHVDRRLSVRYQGDRNVVRVGSEESDVPLFRRDFAAGDTIYVMMHVPRLGLALLGGFFDDATVERVTVALHISQAEF